MPINTEITAKPTVDKSKKTSLKLIVFVLRYFKNIK